MATGARAAHSCCSPARCPSPTIQYSNAGFSNHGSPHSLGVIQSPVSAIARPIHAYRGSSGPRNPVSLKPYRYTAATAINAGMASQAGALCGPDDDTHQYNVHQTPG